MSVRNALFTLFPKDYPTVKYDNVEHIFKRPASIKFTIWSVEKCPDSGRIHIQGYVEMPKPYALGGVKKLFVEPFVQGAHVEKRNGTQQQAIDYCSKEASHVAGPYQFGEKAVPGKRTDLALVTEAINEGADWESIAENFPDQAAKYQGFIKERIERHRQKALLPPSIVLRPWQESLLSLLEDTPSPRQILWYYDEIGNTGKSTFSMWLLRSFPEKVQVFLGGKSVDVAFYLDSSKTIFIFDYSRDAMEYINYGTLEQIKNGFVWSPKYNSMVKQFKTPHVVCFSNQEPDRTKLSRDRWNINHIASLGDWSHTD